jgi:hypothetical protein
MQKLLPAADGNGYTIDGDKAILVTRDYTGVTLAPGDKHADSFDLVPSLSGPYIELEFTVDYEDERQPFHGSRPYFVSIP